MKAKILSLFLFSFFTVAHADVNPKSKAPDFNLTDMNGKDHKLSDFKGKFVVLEWFNPECPFVKKHYGSTNMQNLQKTYTDKGVIWLTIASSAKGKPGFEEHAEALKTQKTLNSHSSFVLDDNKGVVGNLYGAKTTPDMFVISPEQIVLYAGAIDDNPSADPAVIKGSKNYVAAALDASMAGKPVAVAHVKSYGCGVKY